MGVAHWDESVAIAAEEIRIEFDEGLPVAINGRTFDVARSSWSTRPTRSAGATAWG